jgi:hypothetical protein
MRAPAMHIRLRPAVDKSLGDPYSPAGLQPHRKWGCAGEPGECQVT